MRTRRPLNKAEIRWIADAYEEIGVLSIEGYRSTDETLQKAVKLIEFWLEDQDFLVLIGVETGRSGAVPVSMVICHVRASPLDRRAEGVIDAIYVVPRKRRTGTARLLEAEATQWARERGAERMRTFVACWNSPMLAFCERLGYGHAYAELVKTDMSPRE